MKRFCIDCGGAGKWVPGSIVRRSGSRTIFDAFCIVCSQLESAEWTLLDGRWEIYIRIASGVSVVRVVGGRIGMIGIRF